jgi:hypothetical protein
MKSAIAAICALLLAAAAPPPPQPAEHASRDGVLVVTLTAEERRLDVDGLELPGVVYNGDYAGPVLRVRPGDLMSIKLVNAMSQATNLHFHGIRTSPLGNSDNVHLSIEPGQSFNYRVLVSPLQPPGLYWYHAHPHGTSEGQVGGGLSGALIVEDPAAPRMAERLFVLKDMAFNDDTANPVIDDELHSLVQSINGRLDTLLAMRPRETQLWRFSNQSNGRVFHIALAGHRFRVVREDGEPVLDQRWADVLDLNPAHRLEVLVQAGEPGDYPIISKGAMTGTGANRRPERVMGTLHVGGQPTEPVAWPVPAPPPDLRAASIAEQRKVSFYQNKTVKEKDQRFYLNGKLFAVGRIDFRAAIGTVEEWTIANDTDDMHVFHIHQIGFQVVAVNGRPVPFTGYVDTVRVPEQGTVTLRLPFTDRRILGRFMFHCHVLKHEDKGMMAQIEIYDPDATGLIARARRTYMHVWYWLHGVPWELCGQQDI